MNLRGLLGAALSLAAVACSSGDGSPPAPGEGIFIDDRCPGRGHCDSGDGALSVGAGKADITPTVTESEWTDENGDGLYDVGEPFEDVDGNGTFDGVWLAGFSTGRPASSVSDPLEARAIAFRQGDTLLVVAYVDLVGLLLEDTERIAAAVRDLGVDKVIVGATHNHEGPDTIGLWSPAGRSQDYVDFVVEQTAAAIRDAVDALEPATMSWVAVRTLDSLGSTLRYVSDTRDPIIYDPTVTVLRFTAAGGDTIATLVSWAAHAEYAGSLNRELSADFVHWLRDGVEAETGGTVLFVQGALGGQVGPGDASPEGSDGTPISQPGLPKAEAAGTQVAALIVDALGDAAEVDGPRVAYRTGLLHARVDNVTFWNGEGVFPREWFNYDAGAGPSPENPPWLRTRMTLVKLGPVAFITAPGALHPEGLWVGGYDGSWSWSNPLLNEEVNVPDLSLAPQPPYLRDEMLDESGVEHAFVAGLAEDYVGYIVAAFDFVLSDDPYVEKAEGDHYEETRALGPEVEKHVQHRMLDLARAR